MRYRFSSGATTIEEEERSNESSTCCTALDRYRGPRHPFARPCAGDQLHPGPVEMDTQPGHRLGNRRGDGRPPPGWAVHPACAVSADYEGDAALASCGCSGDGHFRHAAVWRRREV